MKNDQVRTAALLAAGVVVGAIAAALIRSDGQRASAQGPAVANDADDLQAEVEAIKGKLADQAHAMQDVGYHYSNLWFAGQHENWPLATFYLQETLSHLRWAVRIIPVRKDSLGQDVDLGAILQAFENTPAKQLQDAIAAQDKPAFEKAYRFTLEICYSCHKASEKPYLRPQIPAEPETPIINFDPSAEWPL
jgi:hypothetical protein